MQPHKKASKVPEKGDAPNFAVSPDLGGGFTIRFCLPFGRHELYKELTLPENPLGSSPSAIFEILRPGFTEGVTISPGCVRMVTFSAPFFGSTVSELTVADSGPTDGMGTSKVKWRQLESSTRLNLQGRDDHAPEFAIELEGGAEFGTLVTLTYNFATAEMHGPLSCFSWGCMPQLLRYHLHSSIVSVWHMEMVRRCYVPIRKPTFTALSADRTEEDAIRAAAAAPKAPAALERCLKRLAPNT